MKIRSFLAALVLTTSGFALAPAYADADDLRPNLVVAVQDDDRSTVADNRQRIMSRVRQAINTSLSAIGYNMYDGEVVMQNILLPNQRRKARETLIEMARAVTQPPLDAALLFKIYASAKKANYSDIYRLHIRIEGDLLNVSSGQVIGGFETSAFDKPVLPVNCDRACVLEAVGKHSRVLAQDLSQAIRAQLDGYLKASGVSTDRSSAKVDTGMSGSSTVTVNSAAIGTTDNSKCNGFPHSYAMSFIGFEAKEQSVIEEFLNSFSCKFQIRALPSSNSQLGFWYETSANDTVLRRNLRTMMEYMEVKAQINIAGTQIKVSKVPTR